MLNAINSSLNYTTAYVKNDALSALLTAATSANGSYLEVGQTDETASDSDSGSRSSGKKLSAEEIMEMMKSGTMPPPPPMNEMEELSSDTAEDDSLSEYDTDGNGSISKEEYETMLSQLGVTDALSADDLYSQYDTDGDGELNSEEIDAIKEQTRPMMPPPPPMRMVSGESTDEGTITASSSTEDSEETALNQIFSKYDTNQDGTIDADEFASMWKNATNAYESNFRYSVDTMAENALNQTT